jgi:hypothetical protein
VWVVTESSLQLRIGLLRAREVPGLKSLTDGGEILLP